MDPLVAAPEPVATPAASLLRLMQCADLFGDLSKRLAADDLLLLSMTCRACLQAVDADDERMAQSLRVGTWDDYTPELKVLEYSDSVMVHLDCAQSKRLRMHLMNSLTGRWHETLYMGIEIKGMHTDDTFTQRVESTRLQKWKVVYVHSEVDMPPQCKYGLYTLTMQCLDKSMATNKEVFMMLDNVELLQQTLKRRSLMALRGHHLCMVCRTRFSAYCAISCPEPHLRKVCKPCAHECLETERTLVREWHVTKEDIAALRRKALRYYSVKLAHFITWITRASVCAHYGCPTWEHFVRSTRARRLHGSGWRAPSDGVPRV